MITTGKAEEIDEILSLTQACGTHLRSQGIDQWDENYPDQKSITEDIQTGNLFTFRQGQHILGIIVLNEHQDEEYALINWSTTDKDKNLVVHRLAVHPDSQGIGIAQKLMDFAESYARLNGYNAIRLDTFSQNPRNQNFYRKRKYTELGSVYLKYKKEHPYICYEMLL